MLVYAERKKPAAQDPEKNPRSKDENWQQTRRHVWESNPGPGGERSHRCACAPEIRKSFLFNIRKKLIHKIDNGASMAQ